MLAGRRVLVFGGTGLLGRHLVEALWARGAAVTIASRRPPGDANVARWVRCDVANEDQVAEAYRQARPEHVVQLAAALQMACEARPEVVVGTNLAGTDAVLRNAARHDVGHVLLASSLAIYGELEGELDESRAPGPSAGLYGSGKCLEEKLGARYATLHGFRFTAMRYCAVFGPGDATSAGMAQVRKRIESTRLGVPARIAEVSGDEMAQLTYVSDAVDATLALMSASKLRHTEYNIAGPRENYMSLRDYHTTVASLFPSTAEVAFTGRARSGGLPCLDRLARDTGFVPSVGVVEGLRLMYADELKKS